LASCKKKKNKKKILKNLHPTKMIQKNEKDSKKIKKDEKNLIGE